MVKCKDCYWFAPGYEKTRGECMVEPPRIAPASLSIEDQVMGWDGPDKFNYERPMVELTDRCAKFNRKGSFL